MRFSIVIVLLLLTGVAIHSFQRPEAIVYRRPLSEFSTQIGDWTMINKQTIDERTLEILHVSDYLIHNYRNPQGKIIGLYIGYFKSQSYGKQIHSPRQCLPGAGWRPAEAGIYKLPIPGSNPGMIQVNRYLMEKGAERQLYLFWYQGRGRVYANEYLNKFYLMWDAITRRRTDGALIRLNMAVNSDPEETLATQICFVRLFFPLLSRYIPE